MSMNKRRTKVKKQYAAHNTLPFVPYALIFLIPLSLFSPSLIQHLTFSIKQHNCNLPFGQFVRKYLLVLHLVDKDSRVPIYPRRRLLPLCYFVSCGLSEPTGAISEKKMGGPESKDAG